MYQTVLIFGWGLIKISFRDQQGDTPIGVAIIIKDTYAILRLTIITRSPLYPHSITDLIPGSATTTTTLSMVGAAMTFCSVLAASFLGKIKHRKSDKGTVF